MVISKSQRKMKILDAIDILGASKVVTAQQAAKAQNRSLADNTIIGYSEEVLCEMRDSNCNSGTDSLLVYLYGISLRQQRKEVGVEGQLCFRASNIWWLGTKEDYWAYQQPDGGSYHLIDFNGRYPRTSWGNQEKTIAQLGDGYERAHEALVTEAAFSVFRTHGKRLLGTWCHWGHSLDSGSCRVFVGGFGSNGWHVSDYPPDCDDGDTLRVCLLRKFSSET